MELMVECYSGHTYAQEPRAFVWQGERYVVEAVKRAWRAPEGPHFLVRTDEGGFFELAYNEAKGVWSARKRWITATPCVNNLPKEDQR
jgi:hypothetical protein